MTKPLRMKKHWGGDEGIWWCKLGTCLQIHSVDALKKLDQEGLLSWSRPNRDSNLVMPLCSNHGVLLSFADEGPIKLEDGITYLL